MLKEFAEMALAENPHRILRTAAFEGPMLLGSAIRNLPVVIVPAPIAIPLEPLAPPDALPETVAVESEPVSER